jgi:hypothetical protein
MRLAGTALVGAVVLAPASAHATITPSTTTTPPPPTAWIPHFRVATDVYPDWSNISYTATHNQVIVTRADQVSKLPLLRAANPDIKIFVYKDLSMMTPWTGPTASSGVTTVDAESHEDWWLHSKTTGARIQSRNWGNWAGNIGNAGYQQKWVENVLPQLQSEGWDGVFLDDTNPSIRGHWDPNDVREYANDAAYAAATSQILAYVYPRVHNAGFLAYANIGDWGFGSAWQASGQRFLTYLDGAEDEHWEPNSIQTANAAYTQAHGKTFLAHQHYNNELYGFATLMLYAERGVYSWQTDYTHDPTWIPQFDIPLGAR